MKKTNKKKTKKRASSKNDFKFQFAKLKKLNLEMHVDFDKDYFLKPADSFGGGVCVGFSSEMENYLTENKRPIHGFYDQGSKTFALCLLELIIYAIIEKRIDDIINFCTMSNNIFIDDEQGYLKYLVEAGFMSDLTSIVSQYRKEPYLMLSEGELDVLREQCSNVLIECRFLQDTTTLTDFGAMFVAIEFAHKIISSGTLRHKFLYSVKVYVENDKIKFWEAEYSEKRVHFGLSSYMLDWIPLNRVEHEYKIIQIDMPSLSEGSAKKIATNNSVMNSIKNGGFDSVYFSFNSLANNYFGVVEFELNEVIKLKYNIKRNMMWKALVDFTLDNTIPILSEQFDVSKTLEEFRVMRNTVAHGGNITYEEFLELSNLMNEGEFIRLIAIAKLELSK